MRGNKMCARNYQLEIYWCQRSEGPWEPLQGLLPTNNPLAFGGQKGEPLKRPVRDRPVIVFGGQKAKPLERSVRDRPVIVCGGLKAEPLEAPGIGG
jgi:hypothetical protein